MVTLQGDLRNVAIPTGGIFLLFWNLFHESLLSSLTDIKNLKFYHHNITYN